MKVSLNKKSNNKNKVVLQYPNKLKSIARFMMIFCTGALFFQTTNLYADSSLANHLLKISPKQCVAVRQGQDCYVDIKIVWQTDVRDNYCLYSTSQSKPLQCWQQVNSILFEKELVSNKNVTFSLKKQNSTQTIATGQLDMAWVYKKNVRSHASWRMF